MKRVLLCGLMMGAAVSAMAQGTTTTLKCTSRGVDIHESRQPQSAVVARINCGDPVLLIDQRFGSAHVRNEAGKDGYIIEMNFGQFSFEPAAEIAIPVRPTATPVPTAPITPSLTTQPLSAPTSIAISPVPTTARAAVSASDDLFRRFELDLATSSYSRQGVVDMYGGNIALTTNITRLIGVTADVSYYRSNGGAFQSSTYRFGPRIYIPIVKRFSTFTEVLIGGTRMDFLNGFTVSKGLALAVGSGTDVRVTPWLTWRSQADYSLQHIFGVYSNGVRTGSGFVFRFGK